MEETHRRPWPHCLIKHIKMNHRNYVVNLKCAQSAKTNNLARPSWISFGVGLVGYRHLVAFFTFREYQAANHKQSISLHRKSSHNTTTQKQERYYIAMKRNMKMLDVITLFNVHFYPLPPIFSTEKKKVMTMPVR